MKQSMRKKIQSSMILVITLTMLIAYAITTLVVYRQTIHIMEGEVRQEADYINVALDTSGESYLKTMDNVHVDTRITLIDPDGKVKYDSKEDDVTLQNHKNRPEVKAALKNGSGQDIRESNTLNKEMFYYAVKLEDGDILRVSKTVDTAFRTAMKVFPAMGMIALLMLAFAGILVKWQVTRLIRPINRLDLENPLENDVYEELRKRCGCQYEKRILGKCISRAEDTAYVNFRLRRNHEKRTGKAGRYERFCGKNL